MESQAQTPDKDQLFEQDSIMENDPQFRKSINSIFDEEKRLLENTNKRFITYFTVFGITEYFLLYIFQRYFYLHKSNTYLPQYPDPKPILDFEISKYYLYRTCSIFFIVFNKKTGPDHIKLILMEFQINKSFLVFVLLDILLILCTISLLQYHPIAAVFLIIHPKIVYQLLSKVLKRYQLRNSELGLISVFFGFIIAIYFFGPERHYYSIITILVSGFLFYSSEELINSNINLQEWEVLRYLSLAFVCTLFLAKEILANNEQIYGFEWTDPVILILILLNDYVRLFVVKRIHTYTRENNSRIYFPLMLVFVGFVSVLFDLLLWNDFLSWGEILGELFFLFGLVGFYKNDLTRLFLRRASFRELDHAEKLVIDK